ncbi:hypothetical protein RJ640_001309 [Escallonia rubra]|uniref:Pentatricopeptide repeat-containing protein n=1 Tax=Escallonia rubra TaxID=112253 RepID=A0AA88QJZ1_9ASTE|nr:hypothetical protein RJ640_001309 [Escallonia rubra]
MEETKLVRVKSNVKTYTTLIHGWAHAPLPGKLLRCFEQMKSAGLKPDKAVYHCLMTSLLSRASVVEEYTYLGILHISSHIEDSDIDDVNDNDDENIYCYSDLVVIDNLGQVRPGELYLRVEFVR